MPIRKKVWKLIVCTSYKEDLASNNLQWLIYYKTQNNLTRPNLNKPNYINLFAHRYIVSGIHPIQIIFKKIGQIKNEKIAGTNVAISSIGIHFGRQCWSLHISGQVCPSSGGSQSRPSDMDCQKPAIVSGTPRPAFSILRGLGRPSGFNVPWRGGGKVYCLTPEVPLFRGMPTGLEVFLEPPGVSASGPT